ncbi:MAG: GNAT family N-acetyltransferase [Acidimicrobiaceae bacterium]|nr:GNAT family N-acetyltransferase [Acidimicrobiaceae bacterium]
MAELRWGWAVERGHTSQEPLEKFAVAFAGWCHAHQQSHRCVVALDADDAVVGFGFTVLTARVPTASSAPRWSADVQAVFVVPELRNAGIGGRLVERLVEVARESDAEHITVHSSPEAVTAYLRSGFVHDPLMLNRPL